MSLRLKADDPLVRNLFTPKEQAAMSKAKGKKRTKLLGEQTAEEKLYNGLQARFLVAGCQLQYQFHETRKWRWDFAWPALSVALEYDGLVLVTGRDGRVQVTGGHATLSGIRKSHAKANAAAINGWFVLRCDADSMRKGTIYDDVEACLRARGYFRG